MIHFSAIKTQQTLMERRQFVAVLWMMWVVATEVGWYRYAGMVAVAAGIVAHLSAPVSHHE